MRALVLCLLLARVASAQPIDTFIAQKMEEAGIVGLGAAVIVDGKVVWTKGFGFADQRRGVPFRPDTVMNIGSITKTVTGVALMRAVQEGKLSLDDDIGDHLPFRVIHPHHPDEKITLRHLATHTSGIADRWAVYRDTYHYGDAPEPLGEFLKGYFVPGGKDYSKDNFLDKKPGTHREYSNIGAGLAGYIVEIAVGEKLETYAKKRIFTPLRMNDTAWSLSAVDPARHSKLYVAHKGLAIPIPLYEGTTYPDGGVRTSVSDLAKLFIALLNGGVYEGTRILDESSVAEMLRFQFTAASKPENVDLAEHNSGIFWRTKFNVTRVGHGGSDPGVQTEMLATLSKDVGVILFSNTSLSDDELRPFYSILNELFAYGASVRSSRSS
ncbi:MAG TPA: serine hydrolase domain-containing protein [Thermoanaerobaculia bacterium]